MFPSLLQHYHHNVYKRRQIRSGLTVGEYLANLIDEKNELRHDVMTPHTEQRIRDILDEEDYLYTLAHKDDLPTVEEMEQARNFS